MSLSSDSAVLTMPVQPANNSYNNGCNGWGGDWMGWIVLFLIFGMFGWGGMGGFGWGGGMGMGGASPYMTSAVAQADLQRGFDNQSVMNKLNGLESGLCDGFYAMNTGMLQVLNVPVLAVETEILAGNETDFVLVHFPVVLLHI